ncbi:MAG: glutathione-disulfide reductase [Pseudomonadales bacterium]|nr:glutathione-disulfide reductase [Pseudomonadales bacterium]
MYDYDLFVIGAGSGGVRAARMAAGFGARVAIAEDRYMGGTCVNVGCIPKKLYSYAAHYHYDFEDSRRFGWSGLEPAFNWATLRDNKKQEISRLNGIYDKILDKAGVQLIKGRAVISGPHGVVVEGKSHSAAHILVATGGWPFVPAIRGHELAVTSNEIFDLASFPERILIVGGGYIAVEFAGIFAGLGSHTTLSYRGDTPLKGFDADIRQAFFSEMQKHVKTLMATNIESITKGADGSLRVGFEEGHQEVFDCVLYATGRKPNTAGLGLENTKVSFNANGSIKVGDGFQTAEPSIYALGDVIGRVALTPVALAEGMLLARRLFAAGAGTMNYDNIPTAVFSHPNIGTVGLSEEQARSRFPDGIRIFKSDFRHLRHTLSGRDERTFIKLIVNKSDDRVVGIHMVGADAGEIIQGFAVAMNCGLTKAQLDTTIGIHPTVAEELVTLREESSQG